MNFNNRNDNFGDQLISYLLYKELKLSNDVYFINTKPEIVDSRPLRIREALLKTILYRIKGKKVILLDPPCARVYFKNMPLPTIKNRIIDWLLQKCITERHVIGISIDHRLPSRSFDIYSTIGVRDNQSYVHISQSHNNVIFTPDMACLMPPKKQYEIGRKNIVSFRKDTPDNNYSSDYSERLSTSLPFIFKLLAASQSNTYFYCQVDEDYAYNSELSLKLLNESHLLTVDKKQAELPYVSLFSDCEYVISNRLHVLLPAMIEGALAIALLSRSHKKIIDLLTSYGLDKTIVYLDSDDEMEKSIQKIIANRNSILKVQYDKLNLLHTQLKYHLKSLTN